MTELLERGLTPAQAEQLKHDGCCVARRMFSPGEIAEIRETFMAEAADGPVPGPSDGGHFAPDNPLASYPRMMNPNDHPELSVGPVARKYLLDPRLKPCLKEAMGEEPVAVQSMFYFKPPKSRGQELHQDNFYLRVAPGTCMAAWIAVDDVDAENGGMKVVHCDMKAGDVLFFNGSVIYGSTPNTSDHRFRCSLIFHYVPRYSQELSHWYRSPTTFDGQVIEIALATGGGPCGIVQPMGPH